jgi:hypothetical protein
MAKVRQQQHRPARDNQRSRELNDLRRENNRLAKQNARLRKQVVKVVESTNMFEGADISLEAVKDGGPLTPEIIEQAHQRSTASKDEPGCSTPECCGTMKVVDLGRAKFLVCPLCKARVKYAP